MMSLHSFTQTFNLSFHGQSKYNLLGSIEWEKYELKNACWLAKFAKDKISIIANLDPMTGKDTKEEVPACCWTSTLAFTKETVQFLEHNKVPYDCDNKD